jgi:O-antigen ligase
MGVLTIALGLMVYRKERALFPRTQAARQVLYLILGYVGFGTLRLIAELIGGTSVSLLATLRNFAIIYYALFAIIGWLVLQRQHAHRLVRSILWTVVAVSTLASLWPTVAYFMGIPTVTDESTIDLSVVIQGHAVVFAMFSLLMVINLLRYGAMPGGLLVRGLTFAAFLLNLLYIYLSGHRSALLGCVVGAIFLAVSSRRRLDIAKRWPWIILALVITACTLYFLADHLAEFAVKFATLGSPLEEANAAWRAMFWLNVCSLWVSHPFVGVGFAHDFFNEDPFHLMMGDHDDPHNSYLAILARTGLIGLFFVLAASMLFVRLMIKVLRRSSSQQTILLASCLLTSFSAIASFAAANVTLESPYHAMFFWLFIGMGVFLADNDLANPDNSGICPAR